ncbi:MAG: hypothetical protein JWN94_2008 [Betaproteobacteria bacterium]|nr:hypothetical protein [Betaproteobacteria bacterium]
MSATAEVSVVAAALDSDTSALPIETIARISRRSGLLVAVGILTTIALVAALYLARAFFVPLLIGILASYALSPLVDWLKSHRVPGPLAAAVVLAALVGGLSWVAVTLNDEAVAMIEKLPDAAHKLRESLSVARAGGPTALQKLQEAANEIQGAATDAAAKAGTHVIAAKPAEPSLWLRDYALAQSALLIAVAAQTPIVLLLTYFLLASGSHFRRKLVQLVGPSLTRKKDAVRILEEIDVQIQRYLLAMLISNALLGVCSWLAFSALGLEQAGVWGAAAGVLHFIPYLGSILVAIGSGVAAFLQFGSLVDALMIAGASLAVAAAVGFVFMTWLQSRFARANVAVLFIALLFFGWLWGVAGLLLGAPLLAIIKVICDRVDTLNPVGELLGR